MIVFSDLHLREDTADVVFGQVLPALFQAAKEDQPGPDGYRWIACLGDLWHIRYRIPVVLLNRLFAWAEDLGSGESVKLILLPGNHDQVNLQGEHALEALARLRNVLVYSRPTWDQWGLWVPYRKDRREVEQALELLGPPGHSPVLWIHHGVRGAAQNDHREDRDGLDLQLLGVFGRFSRVFAGHYHKPQDLGLLSYVGSPYEVTADEHGQVKRYGVWNGQAMRWVAVNWGTRHHQVTYRPGEEQAPPQVRPGDQVRLTAPAGAEAEVAELARRLTEQGARVVVTQQVVAQEGRLNVAEGAPLTAYAREYVGKFAGGLDAGRLLAVLDEIVNPGVGA